MPDTKSNVEILEEAGVLDTSEMTKEDHRVINEELSEDEVKALIKTKDLLRPKYPLKPPLDDGFF